MRFPHFYHVDDPVLTIGGGTYDWVFVALNPFVVRISNLSDKSNTRSWNDASTATGIIDLREVCHGARTAHGSLKTNLRDERLGGLIDDFVERQNLWLPDDGVIVPSLIKDFVALFERRTRCVYAVGEFDEEGPLIEIGEIGARCGDWTGRLIAEDNSLYIQSPWEGMVTLVAGMEVQGLRIEVERLLEGFWSTSQTTAGGWFREGPVKLARTALG